MDRRKFVEVSLGAVASTALAACFTRRSGPSAAAAPSPVMDAAAFHRERRFVETGFGRIAYAERGRGDAALFLHGFPLNGFEWRGELALLSPYRRCIAPDFMGLGYSEIPDGQSVAPDAQVAMIVELLDKLGVSKADVIANDSGGAVAQLFVTAHPERVRTLLLTNCDAEHDSPPPSFGPLLAAARAHVLVDRSFAPMLANTALARSQKAMGAFFSDPSHPTDEDVEVYFRPLVSSPLRKRQAEDYAIALEKNWLAGIEPALRRCTVPTRIVWGMADKVFSPASPDWLDHAFGNSRGVRRVEGGRLYMPEDMPGVIAEEARRLWGVA